MENEKIIISHVTGANERLEAVYLPWQGMNFISFKKGSLEVIDQSTQNLFEDRYAGLGAMIGPHFHHRNPNIIPKIQDEALFPHIARVKAKGTKEPFSHGIGRYAPWKIEKMSEDSIGATLKGTDEWKGVKLKDLEGQDFVMNYHAKMGAEGLLIELSVISDTGSVMGLHTYYAMAGQKGKITAQVQPQINDHGQIKNIPSSWNYDKNHFFHYDAKEEIDAGFYPFPDALAGQILYETATHSIKISYSCDNQENSWQLWHPSGASFVCIEPLSAKIPQKPILSVSKIKILISIL